VYDIAFERLCLRACTCMWHNVFSKKSQY